MSSPKPYCGSVVIVDDEENMGHILSRILQLEGYHTRAFSKPADAVEEIRRQPPDLVITDMRMPGMDGIEVVRAAKGANSHTNVIVMTAYATVEKAVEAMRSGAFDYITKPFKTDELLLTVSKAIEHTRLREENEALTETLHRQAGVESELSGQSPAMAEVRRLLERVAPSDSVVLIRGESGTGKELAAKMLHRLSKRAQRKFVAVNCASLPENLIESELFGHEKGAFTGADRTKMGLMELAHGGTLFLDEIGELPLPLQGKLLRALQEREIQRVGGLHTLPVDFRLVAATNRDLKRAVGEKEFREDLYYRLNVIEVVMPPLRDRKDDIPLLMDLLVSKISKRMGKQTPTVTHEAMEALEAYSFPGNVRELENVAERCVVLSDGVTIELEDIPLDIRRAAEYAAPAGDTAAGVSADYRAAKDAFERDFLTRALAQTKGNISEASRATGLSRRHLYEKLEKLGIKAER